MPPRSFYLSPKKTDYSAFLRSRGYEDEHIHLAEKFYDEHGLPFINYFGELAAYIGVETRALTNLLRKKENNYRSFEITQFNGKVRQISSPRTYIKVVQWWILDNILSKAEQLDCVHGFTKDKSYYTNAQVHLCANHLLTLDIKDFFPSVKHRQVTEIFHNLGYPLEARNLLADITTLNNSLPQGAPTSPTLSNLVFRKIDLKFMKFAADKGLLYTRYADDLTFSSSHFINKATLDPIKEILASSGFRLNSDKTKFLGKGDRMEVTGIVINEKMQLPRKWRYRARAMFYQAINNPKLYLGRVDEIQGVLNTLIMFDDNLENPTIKSGKTALKICIQQQLSEMS